MLSEWLLWKASIMNKHTCIQCREYVTLGNAWPRCQFWCSMIRHNLNFTDNVTILHSVLNCKTVKFGAYHLVSNLPKMPFWSDIPSNTQSKCFMQFIDWLCLGIPKNALWDALLLRWCSQRVYIILYSLAKMPSFTMISIRGGTNNRLGHVR